jgi:probable HAF family extracellular repeat protein
MQDLGTLGTGTDALAGLINERGQVVGVSYVNSIPTASCFNPQLNISFAFTTGSFIWDKKNGMRDIGGLGGTCTLARDINNRGQIVGRSSLAGDQTSHAFVWDAGTGITDLMGAASGSFGDAFAINYRGQIVGAVCDAVTCDAAMW